MKIKYFLETNEFLSFDKGQKYYNLQRQIGPHQLKFIFNPISSPSFKMSLYVRARYVLVQ